MIFSRTWLIYFTFLLQLLHSEGAKILSVSLIGGSHYLQMDEISRILHERGHRVRMLLQTGNPIIAGLNYVARPRSYQITAWNAGEEYVTKFNYWFREEQKEFLVGKESASHFQQLIGYFAFQCNKILAEADIMAFLKHEAFDLAIIDAFTPCSFLITEKLGLKFIAVYPGALINGAQTGIPTPPSYVPIYRSLLSDQMNFLERVKNCMMHLFSNFMEHWTYSQFDYVIQNHFHDKPRPSICEVYLKAELLMINTDFSLEFARPLHPNTILIGGLLSKPAKPISQELEEFIAKSGGAGFIVVTLGSMLSSITLREVIQEMNTGFAHLPQAVIWRYEPSFWPDDLELAPNVKLVDWLPQNDLLGHPKAQLLVTHGGQNSLLQAVYHGVPILGIPLFGDQFDNLIRAEAKGLGIYFPVNKLNAHNFAEAMRKVIQDKRYKSAALNLSNICHSQPLPPEQRLVHWVEHILQCGGGGHLRPYGLQQPWYQQYLLDVFLFMTVTITCIIYTTVKVMKTATGMLWPSTKLKHS